MRHTCEVCAATTGAARRRYPDRRSPKGALMPILDQFSLAGQKAVVTGAGKGIGRGIALCLAEAGADVVVAARTKSQVDEVAQEISRRGRKGVGLVADV